MAVQILIVVSIFNLAYAVTTAVDCYTDCCSSQELDCFDYRQMGHIHSGVYRVIPPEMKSGYDVYCDMITDGGGWTVFHRREDGSAEFYRNWTDYELGFGATTGEHWLGFIPLSRIMSKGYFELRIDLEGWQNDTKYATYTDFSLDFANDYRLNLKGYNGTAGDSMVKSIDAKFSTEDKLSDTHLSKNCVKYRKGPWWYTNCAHANLNGKYYTDGNDHDDGVFWRTWNGDESGDNTNVRKAEMKIRRL